MEANQLEFIVKTDWFLQASNFPRTFLHRVVQGQRPVLCVRLGTVGQRTCHQGVMKATDNQWHCTYIQGQSCDHWGSHDSREIPTEVCETHFFFFFFFAENIKHSVNLKLS